MTFTRLQVVTKSLEVLAERLDDPQWEEAAASADARTLMARADTELTALERMGAAGAAAEVRSRLEVYGIGLQDELGLLRAGRRAEARLLDETVVDPRFESLEERLDELAADWTVRAGKVHRTRRAGSAFALMAAAALAAATVTRFVRTRERIRILEEQRAQLSHRAAHDPLTGLANRDRFRTVVASALGREDRPGVAFVDLDGFKEVNDVFGHAAGDAVLRAAAERIQSAVRGDDVAARLGGDEFAVLLPDAPDREAAGVVAERIRSRLADPFTVQGHHVAVGASVGLAFGAIGESAEELLRRADSAMYAAKNAGKRRLVIDGGERRTDPDAGTDATLGSGPVPGRSPSA
jgi:diguanylate cyclase (GGDEF)-like protein